MYDVAAMGASDGCLKTTANTLLSLCSGATLPSNHRKNMIFTNRRLIQHSVLLSALDGHVVNSILQFWVVDKFSNLSVVELGKKKTCHATAQNFGHISFESNLDNKFIMFVFRSLYSPRVECKRVQGMARTPINAEQWRAEGKHADAKITSCSLTDTGIALQTH